MSEENKPPTDENRPSTEEVKDGLEDVTLDESGSKPEESQPDDVTPAAVDNTMSEGKKTPTDENRPSTEEVKDGLEDVTLDESGSKPEESKPDNVTPAAAEDEPSAAQASEDKKQEETVAPLDSKPKTPDESQNTGSSPAESQDDPLQSNGTAPGESQDVKTTSESQPPAAAAEETNGKPSERKTDSGGDEEEEIALGGPNIGGLYEHVRSENFEEYLAANGANFMIRKLAGRSNPDLEVWQDGDQFVIKVLSAFMTRETEFTVGKEYIEKQPNGVQFKCLSKWEGNKLVTTFEPKEAGKGKSQTVTREVNGTEFTQTMSVGDLVATRIFKMVARQKSQGSEPEKIAFADPNNPFKGKYKHLKDDDFEGALRAMGLPYLMRKLASKTSPTVEVDQDGDHFGFNMVSTFISKKNEFRIGEEFEDTSPNGIAFKAMPSWDDDKIKIDLTPKEDGKGKPQTTYRELVGNQLHIRFEIGDVKGARMFERVE